MLKLEDISIDEYFCKYINGFELVGFIDVTCVYETNKKFEEDIYYGLKCLPHERENTFNKFGWLACDATIKTTGKDVKVIPVFFGERSKYLFDTECHFSFSLPDDEWREKYDETSDKLNTSKPYIVYFKGNDDWSVGTRFATKEEREAFLSLDYEIGLYDELEGQN